jgi:phosphatidate cytidylyltransferase
LAAPANSFKARRADVDAVLRTRVITAFFIAVTAFTLLFLAPSWIFKIAMAILLMAGSWEFARLAALGRIGKWVLILLQALLLGMMLRLWNGIEAHALSFLVAAALSWCVMFLRLLTFRPGLAPDLNYRLVSFFCALASITFAWFSLCWLRDQPSGEYLVLLLLVIIWSADIGAYFSGRRWGRHKLAPTISPGKTREGLLGGALLAALCTVLVAHWTIAVQPAPAILIVLAMFTTLVSAAGDLFISLHKRTVGLKDSGKLFPGHGGVLDRFDSLLAGAPFFALGALLLQW